MKARRPISVVATLLLALCSLLSYGLCRWIAPYRPTIHELPMKGSWIRAMDEGNYTACFRKTFELPARPKNAWIAISACDAFEVMVNGNTAARQFLWRPTRPFQNGLSEEGQKIDDAIPVIGLNFPREYQWSGHRNYLLPAYVDITPLLVAGTNVICIETESRTLRPKMILDGEVLTETGGRVTLNSDRTWKAVALPPDGSAEDWELRKYVDATWPQAEITEPPPGRLRRTFEPSVFSEPFSAPWLRSAHPSMGKPVEFEQMWELAEPPVDAWLRIAANRNYDLFINGRRVNSNNPSTGGEWVIGSQRAADAPTMPEILDPDEVGSLFVGTRFEAAPHGDPTANDFHPFSDALNRTHDRPNADAPDMVPGDLDPIKERGRLSQPYSPDTYAPLNLQPTALSRNQQIAAFDLYDIRWMLKRGTNRIKVRLIPTETILPLKWEPQFAIDGRAFFKSGKGSPLSSERGWTSLSPMTNGAFGSVAPIIQIQRDGNWSLPKKTFRGCISDASEKFGRWLLISALTFLTLGGLGLMWLLPNEETRRAWRGEESAPVRRFCKNLAAVLLPPVITLFGALLVEFSWSERHEMLYFHEGRVWALLVAFAVGITLIGAFCLLRHRRSSDHSASASRWIQSFPSSLGWKFLIVWLLLACAFLRAYQLDVQPLDDDEYASTQAVMAIAMHGVPKFTNEVYYTRSPFYHYLTGGIVAVFGQNIWAVRLPSVAFGVATALLTYLAGVRLLGSHWVGLGALILYIIHPYAIFSAHIGRFYQQQQFFAFLTIYWFCRGMVTEQSMRHRYLMLGSLLAAILSQELSIVICFPIAVGYLLFAERKPWPQEARFLVAAMCIIGLAVIDVAIFQTRCLTRTEGVSPNVEPALKPNFFYPMNIFTMFIAYSRLHLALSVLLALGFPFAIRSRHRGPAALYFMLFSGLLFTIFFVTSASLRYQYWLLPLWILLGLFSTKALIEALACLSTKITADREKPALLNAALATLLFAAVVLSFSPWRIADSYEAKLLPDSTSAFRFVHSQLRDGDAVAATEPHPHAALIETGRVDYDLSVPVLHDFVYEKDGRLIDRNGGAELICSLAQLQQACSQHRRLWVVVNREKFRSRGRNIRWEYPGARVELFLRENCQVKYRSCLWTVYLWDAGTGTLHNFRDDRAAAL